MNALSDLLNLPKDEKISRGLLHTPAEIAQQPDTRGLRCDRPTQGSSSGRYE